MRVSWDGIGSRAGGTVAVTGSLERTGAHEGAALVDDRRGRSVEHRLARFDRGTEGFGAVLRPVADVARRVLSHQVVVLSDMP